MFPDDEGLQKIKSRIFDPFEYLSLRDKDGLLKKDFKKEFDKIVNQMNASNENINARWG